MKLKNIKMVFTGFLSILLSVILTVQMVLSVYAEEDNTTSLNKLPDIENVDIPKIEQSIKAAKTDAESLKMIYRKTKSSDGGIINEYWVDENGNPVELKVESQSGAAAITDIPDKYSLVDDNLVTSVKNQGTEGLCWAFAGLGSIESSLVKQNYYNKDDSAVDFSESHLSYFALNGAYTVDENSPIYGDGTVNEDIFSDTNSDDLALAGNAFYTLSTISSWAGAELEVNAPYEERGNKNFDRSHSYAHIQNFDMLTNPEEVKNAILNTGAVQCSYYSETLHYGTSADGQYTFRNPEEDITEETGTNHAVLVVGWDDNFDKDNFKNKAQNNGAWLIRNSWGEEWGNDGYFWMSYDEPSLKFFYSFQGIPAEKDYKNNYQYDGFGGWSAVNCAYSSNIFKAKGNEVIKGTRFYTAEADYAVKASVYLLNDSPKSPIDGELIYSQSNFYPYSGYHTLDFDESICVSEGQNFSVVIFLSSSGERVGSYVEGNTTEMRQFTSKANQSFLSFDGKEWLDASENNVNNVPVKAFTNDMDSLSELYTKADLDNLKAQAEEILNNEDDYARRGVEILSEVFEAANKALSQAEIHNCCIRLKSAIETINDYTVYIESADEFIKFIDDISSGNDFDGYKVCLEKDIVFTDEDSVEFDSYSYNNKIGFNGEFYGNNHIIKGIKKDFDSGSYRGIFPYIAEKGIVRDLNISDCHFSFASIFGGIITGRNDGEILNCNIAESTAESSADYIGGIVGVNFGNITNCIITNLTAKSSSDYVGGIAGGSVGNITNCASMNANITGNNYVGGIAGYLESSLANIINCISRGYIDGSYVGGIAGYLSSFSNIKNCTSYVNVTGSEGLGGIVGFLEGNNTILECENNGNIIGSSYAGGIVGYGKDVSNILKCANYEDVTVTGYDVGGIIGYYECDEALGNDSCYNIIECKNNGNITGDSYAGGISGYGNAVSNILKCANYGDVTATNDVVGGIIGYFGFDESSKNDSCYNRGTIISTSGKFVGGIAGCSEIGTTVNCYSTGKVKGNLAGIIVGYSEEGADTLNCCGMKADEDGYAETLLGNGDSATSTIESKEYFNYGVVAKMLNENNDNGNVFGQIDGDEYPVFADDQHIAVTKVSSLTINTKNCTAELPVDKAAAGFKIAFEATHENEVSLVSYKYSYGGNEYDMSMNGNTFSFIMPEEDTAVNLVYLPDVTVSFYDGDNLYLEDSEQKPQSILYGSKAVKPAQPSKEGYIFKYWTSGDNDTEFDFETPIEEEMKLYAVWLPENYNIIINNSGDTAEGSYPVDYNIESDDITISQPTKAGYVFLGWSGTDITGYTQTITINKGSTGTKEYNANWIEIPTDLTAFYNQTLEDVELPDGFIWKDKTQSVGDIGTNEFTVIYTALADGNEYVFEFNINVAVKKLDSNIIPPTSNKLTYTGDVQELVTSGSSSRGTMQYSTDGVNYSTNIPTAVNAGEYSVYYRVVDSYNPDDVNEVEIKVSIEKAESSIISYPTAIEKLIYNGTNQALIKAGEVTGGILKYRIDDESYEDASVNVPEKKEAGDYKIYYKVFGDANHKDSEEFSLSVKIDVSPDITEDPNEIKLGDVDNEKGITVNDAVLLLQKVLDKHNTLPIEEKTSDYMKYADVDGDEELTASDAAIILQKVLNSDFVMPVKK